MITLWESQSPENSSFTFKDTTASWHRGQTASQRVSLPLLSVGWNFQTSDWLGICGLDNQILRRTWWPCEIGSEEHFSFCCFRLQLRWVSDGFTLVSAAETDHGASVDDPAGVSALCRGWGCDWGEGRAGSKCHLKLLCGGFRHVLVHGDPQSV